MVGSQNPLLRLKITPAFLPPSAASLGVVLTIECPTVERGSAVVVANQALKSGTTLHDMQAVDDEGELPMWSEISSENGYYGWVADRDMSGDVELSYAVALTPIQKQTSSIYLDASGKGFLDSGWSFVYIPPGNNIYQNIVGWDLSGSPEGTRAVWTFGEGPDPVGKMGPASILSDSVYMAGQIQSNPPPGNPSDYGYYWFGDIPSNVSDIHHESFRKASEFFDDPLSKLNPYRSFLRNNGTAKCMGGTSFNRSHIFDYDDLISQATDYDLVRYMSHKMIHIWLGPTASKNQPDWLFEGISNALSVCFPFRFKFLTPHYFFSTVNMLLTKYYTSSLIEQSHADLLKLVPTDFYAQQLLGARAWVCIIGADIAARHLSDVTKRPIEDLGIKPLAKKKAIGDRDGIEDFIGLLQPLMGDKITELYEDMCKDSVMLLPVKGFFGPKTHRLMPIDQQVLDFGIDVVSFDNEVEEW
jgi:hypothetical protein